MFRSSELNKCSPSGRLFRAALGAHTMLLQGTSVACQAQYTECREIFSDIDLLASKTMDLHHLSMVQQQQSEHIAQRKPTRFRYFELSSFISTFPTETFFLFAKSCRLSAGYFAVSRAVFTVFCLEVSIWFDAQGKEQPCFLVCSLSASSQSS
jgi:hypothetical protein